MSKIRINDADIYYEEHGEGMETLLLIHGLFMNCRMYDQQIAALEDRYRIIVYDLRGQGKSEVTSRGYSLYELVDDAAKLIEQLECAPCHVAGISMGGYIALRLAKRHPQLVRSLTLISTSAAAEEKSAARQFKLLGFIHNRISQPFAVKQIEPILFGEKFREDPAQEQVRAYWHQRFLSNNKHAFGQTLNGILTRDDVTGDLVSIELPALIISGEVDAAADPAQSVYLHAKLPNSRLVKIPEVGHTPPVEAPDTVNAAMLEFLVSMSLTADLNLQPKQI